MTWLGELARRLLILLRGRQFDGDLEEEMRLHQELREQEQVERVAQRGKAATKARDPTLSKWFWGRLSLSFLLEDSRTVLAVKGSLRRGSAPPLTAAGRSAQILL